MFQLSKHYRCRASELLGVHNEWEAFQIDRAVYAFGSALSAELEGCEGKDKAEIERKRLGVASKWLPKALDASETSGRRFADPASRSI